MTAQTRVEWTGNIEVHQPMHKLISDWQGSPAPSTHRCACGWEVRTYTSPGQATAEAVQAAFDKHTEPKTGVD